MCSMKSINNEIINVKNPVSNKPGFFVIFLNNNIVYIPFILNNFTSARINITSQQKRITLQKNNFTS